MKLDLKCIRDILLMIQDESSLNNNLVPNEINMKEFYIHELTKKYSREEIVYTLRKLKEAGYIIANFQYASNSLYHAAVTELTYDGHQFLASISNSKVFDSVMDKLDEFGSGVTLEVLKSLANKIMKEKLGL